MATGKNWQKLSRTPAHRRALMRTMATSLFLHEKMKTTLPKACELKRYVDRLLSRGRRNDLASRRYVARFISDARVQKKIFDVLIPRYHERVGGYSQIFKIGYRMSDGSPMGIIRLMQ
jgi:large subunit ribosomal protein L17